MLEIGISSPFETNVPESDLHIGNRVPGRSDVDLRFGRQSSKFAVQRILILG